MRPKYGLFMFKGVDSFFVLMHGFQRLVLVSCDQRMIIHTSPSVFVLLYNKLGEVSFHLALYSIGDNGDCPFIDVFAFLTS